MSSPSTEQTITRISMEVEEHKLEWLKACAIPLATTPAAQRQFVFIRGSAGHIDIVRCYPSSSSVVSRSISLCGPPFVRYVDSHSHARIYNVSCNRCNAYGRFSTTSRSSSSLPSAPKNLQPLLPRPPTFRPCPPQSSPFPSTSAPPWTLKPRHHLALRIPQRPLTSCTARPHPVNLLHRKSPRLNCRIIPQPPLR